MMAARLTCTLLAMGLFGLPDMSPTPEVREAYEAAKAKVGRGAEAQVELALWCEAHGLMAERDDHLSLAVAADSKDVRARGLLGQLAHKGRWVNPEDVQANVKADAELAAALAEYAARREKVKDSADAQFALAVWCDQHGLRPEAEAHFTAVTRLAPSREAAWKALGYVRHGGRWMTPAQIAAERAEADTQRKADLAWGKKLGRWQAKLGQKGKSREAELDLAGVTDPRAVRSIWALFVREGAHNQGRAVQLLGQIDSPLATKRLSQLAVFSDYATVRRDATATLVRRDPRDFVGMLVPQVRTVLRHEVRAVGGPGQPGVLFVEGERFNVRRFYDAPLPPPTPPPPTLLERRASLDLLPSGARFAALAATTVLFLDDPRHVKNQGVASHEPPHYGAPGHEAPQHMPAHPMPVQPGQPGTWGQPAPMPNLGFQPVPMPGVGVQPAPMLGNPGHITIQRGPGEGPFTIDLTPPPPPPPPPAEDAGQRRRREEDEAFRTNMAQWQSTVIYNWYEAQSAALTASQRLGADIAAVEGYNQAVRFYNGRVLGVLQAVTQQQFGHDREAWARWWADSRGYAYDGARPGPKPTIDVAVQDFVPQFASPTYIYVHNSCFAAGTPVRTLNGRLPIEALKVGDRLLVEDPATGALSFQPIVAVFHNPPAPTLRVELEDESIVVTGIHRFWVAGRGWRMARELKPGDAVRLVGGIARVAAVKPDATQKVYNLEVASGRSFFVGRRGALVHDNTTVEPTPRPFDAQAATLAD